MMLRVVLGFLLVVAILHYTKAGGDPDTMDEILIEKTDLQNQMIGATLGSIIRDAITRAHARVRFMKNYYSNAVWSGLDTFFAEPFIKVKLVATPRINFFFRTMLDMVNGILTSLHNGYNGHAHPASQLQTKPPMTDSFQLLPWFFRPAQIQKAIASKFDMTKLKKYHALITGTISKAFEVFRERNPVHLLMNRIQSFWLTFMKVYSQNMMKMVKFYSRIESMEILDGPSPEAFADPWDPESIFTLVTRPIIPRYDDQD